MTDQNFLSYLHLVKRAAIHSQQFRHTNYSSRNLSDNAIEDIGLQLVNLFEELYERNTGSAESETRPRKGTPNDPADGENGQVTTRPQPYR